ncbi:hypothetical protein, partial [Pseudomonas putida]
AHQEQQADEHRRGHYLAGGMPGDAAVKSLFWCKKAQLFISNAPFKFTKATFCAFQVQHELLRSGSISFKNNQFAETFS